jgi:hypothetical protein
MLGAFKELFTMATIEVDFHVFKELTLRRENEEVTYNDVLRDVLGLPPITLHDEGASAIGGWEYKGVLLPNGTELKRTYKGKTFSAKVTGNKLMLDGKAMNSPSEAANSVTDTAVNGWTFWKCKFPNSNRWQKLSALRAKD